jgi:hypothetical protein
MRRTGFLLAVLCMGWVSCNKKNEEPKYAGEVLLSSELRQSGQDYVFYGFSFETGKISTYSLTSSSLPDLAAIHVIMGDNITVDLTSSNDQDAFYENASFQNAQEAEAYYNNYGEVLATDFQSLAQTIRENQVWTVQTVKNCFAKIWIKEINIRTGALSDYAEVIFQYQYQPDGSRTFDCGCD